jgi:N-methylhydantoinase A/oxoprolinase/acetone carboxylase beta subunit
MSDSHCSSGTDVGGAFIDLVFLTPDGQARRMKVPGTPSRPGNRILGGVAEIRAVLRPDEAAWRAAFHTHGSTVATNGLIKGRHAGGGRITTPGLHDRFDAAGPT